MTKKPEEEMKEEEFSEEELELAATPIYLDTTNIIPGVQVWIIEPIKPSEKVPYTTFRPVPRIVTQVHNNGVNGGTVFMSYKPEIYTDIMDRNHRVEAIEHTFYSPLTKEQAIIVCRKLNNQMKHFYEKNMQKLGLYQSRNIKKR